MTRILLILILGFACLPSCSRLDLAFHWADTYIVSKVDDYFDISSRQSKELKKSLKKDFKKVSKSVLPKIIADVKKFETDLQVSNLQEETLASFFTESTDYFEDFASYFADSAVTFIATADAKQLAYFEKAFHEKQSEEREKLADLKKYQSDSKEKYQKYFKMFLGTLTSDQKILIDKHLQESPYPKALKLKNKDHVFASFMKAAKTSPLDAKEFVEMMAQNPQRYNLPEYQTAFEHYREDLKKLLVSVVLSLTPEQKKELKENLQEKVSQIERIRSEVDLS